MSVRHLHQLFPGAASVPFSLEHPYVDFALNTQNVLKILESITLWGTGNESRDFIFIDDIVRIIDLIIEHADFRGEAVNVANGRQETIKDVAQTFARIIGSDKSVIFNNAVRKGDPLNREADIDIIKSWGYRQSRSLEDGIKKYLST